jgi:hypothetical protein
MDVFYSNVPKSIKSGYPRKDRVYESDEWRREDTAVLNIDCFKVYIFDSVDEMIERMNNGYNMHTNYVFDWPKKLGDIQGVSHSLYAVLKDNEGPTRAYFDIDLKIRKYLEENGGDDPKALFEWACKTGFDESIELLAEIFCEEKVSSNILAVVVDHSYEKRKLSFHFHTNYYLESATMNKGLAFAINEAITNPERNWEILSKGEEKTIDFSVYNPLSYFRYPGYKKITRESIDNRPPSQVWIKNSDVSSSQQWIEVDFHDETQRKHIWRATTLQPINPMECVQLNEQTKFNLVEWCKKAEEENKKGSKKSKMIQIKKSRRNTQNSGNSPNPITTNPVSDWITTEEYIARNRECLYGGNKWDQRFVTRVYDELFFGNRHTDVDTVVKILKKIDQGRKYIEFIESVSAAGESDKDNEKEISLAITLVYRSGARPCCLDTSENPTCPHENQNAKLVIKPNGSSFLICYGSTGHKTNSRGALIKSRRLTPKNGTNALSTLEDTAELSAIDDLSVRFEQFGCTQYEPQIHQNEVEFENAENPYDVCGQIGSLVRPQINADKYWYRAPLFPEWDKKYVHSILENAYKDWVEKQRQLGEDERRKEKKWSFDALDEEQLGALRNYIRKYLVLDGSDDCYYFLRKENCVMRGLMESSLIKNIPYDYSHPVDNCELNKFIKKKQLFLRVEGKDYYPFVVPPSAPQNSSYVFIRKNFLGFESDLYLNTYRPPPWRIFESPEEIDVEFIEGWLKQIKYVICSGNHTVFTYLIAWIAYMIQHPERKEHQPQILYLFGPQGVGKNIFMRLLREMVGAANFYMVNNKGTLKDTFNSQLSNRVLTVWDEYNGRMAREGEQYLKAVSGEKTTTERGLYKEERNVTNFSRHMVMSNFNNLRIEAGRRPVIFFMNTKWLYENYPPHSLEYTKYFKFLAAALEDPKFLCHFYNYLYHTEVPEDIDFSDMPEPDPVSRDNIMEKSMPAIHRWLLDRMKKARDDGWHTFGNDMVTDENGGAEKGVVVRFPPQEGEKGEVHARLLYKDYKKWKEERMGDDGYKYLRDRPDHRISTPKDFFDEVQRSFPDLFIYSGSYRGNRLDGKRPKKGRGENGEEFYYFPYVFTLNDPKKIIDVIRTSYDPGRRRNYDDEGNLKGDPAAGMLEEGEDVIPIPKKKRMFCDGSTRRSESS